MTIDRFHCGQGCGDVTYCVELYGLDGPLPLHNITHHSNERPAANGPLTTGPRSEKGGRLMAPDASVPTGAADQVEPSVGRHYDTVIALRRWGQGQLADNLLTVLVDRSLEHESTLIHVENLLADAMEPWVCGVCERPFDSEVDAAAHEIEFHDRGTTCWKGSMPVSVEAMEAAS